MAGDLAGRHGALAVWKGLGLQGRRRETVAPDRRQQIGRASCRESDWSSDVCSSDLFEAEWRVIWPDGTARWLFGRAWVFKDGAGKPLRLIGANRSEERRAGKVTGVQTCALPISLKRNGG